MDKLYSLYFEDRHNQSHLIGKEVPANDISRRITAHVQHLNPNYRIYYIRNWEDPDGTIHYDVGSWSEFFKAVPM